MRDRRALFFAVFAAVCFVLVPIAQPKFRFLAEITGAVYVVLAVLSLLDARGRERQ